MLTVVASESPCESGPVPRHVAVIMDGNGRWARRRHRPRAVGHRAGVRAVNLTIDYCIEREVSALTLFAFSSENWRRPVEEVDALMQLFLRALEREVDELDRRGVRLRFIGDRGAFAEELKDRMAASEHRTAGNQGLQLTIAANYGGRWDIAQAARRAFGEPCGADAGQVNDIDRLESELATDGLGDVDLMIRSGGERRISNFLLWQLAYAELCFLDVLWPDVGRGDLDAAFTEYASRERRFGDVAVATGLPDRLPTHSTEQPA